MKISLKIITPEKVLFEGDLIDSIKLPTDQGSFQIYVNHASLVSQLDKGIVLVSQNAEEVSFEIRGGLVNFENNQAIILAG